MKVLLPVLVVVSIAISPSTSNADTNPSYDSISKLSASMRTTGYQYVNAHLQVQRHTCPGGDGSKFTVRLDGSEGAKQIVKLATAFYLSGTNVKFTYTCSGSIAFVSYIQSEPR